jgi:HEAT repeat protein
MGLNRLMAQRSTLLAHASCLLFDSPPPSNRKSPWANCASPVYIGIMKTRTWTCALILATGATLPALGVSASNAAASDVQGMRSSIALEDDARLKQARDGFATGQEGPCRDAANLCAAINTVASVEILLEVLNSTGYGPGLPAGHYRDIAWEGALKVTDPYARARFEVELKRNKQSPWVRAWCAQLLGIYGEARWIESLTKALKDKDLLVRSSAAESLGKLKLTPGKEFDKTIKALNKVAKGKDARSRADALIALMRLQPDVVRPAYLAAIGIEPREEDGGARCALVGALRSVAMDDFELASSIAIDDEDWRTRLQAVDNLSTSKTKTAVDRLIDATEDGRPSVRLRSVAGLQGLTGQAHRTTKSWRAWWAANRETFTFPEGSAVDPNAVAVGDSVATYNGMRVTSDHVAFLIDKSAAMGEFLNSEGMSKEQFAQEQLGEVLGKLPEGVMFNIYTYELDVVAFDEKRPVELDPKKVKKALKFVEDQRLRGSKDIWKVLDRVVADPEIDTIYLLSSGEPDTGKYVHWNRVTEHLKDLNRFHKVVVHTISYSDNQWYRDQLEKIAQATGGEFKFYE